MKVQHLVLTRYTVKGLFYDDFSPQWLEERLRLFRTYCVPGMERQTAKDFTWLIFCDETTDPAYVDEIRASAASVPQLRIAPTSRERRIRLPEAVAPFIDDDTDVLITTRLDTDDSLNTGSVAAIQGYLTGFLASPYGKWMVTFPRGYRYDESTGRLFACYWPHCPFMSMFERLRPGSKKFRGVYKRNHHKLHLDTPVHFDESIPEWLQVIHGVAASTAPRSGTVLTGGNWGTTVGKDDLEVELAELDAQFGVDLSASGCELRARAQREDGLSPG
jgi:hypothetical protein